MIVTASGTFCRRCPGSTAAQVELVHTAVGRCKTHHGDSMDRRSDYLATLREADRCSRYDLFHVAQSEDADATCGENEDVNFRHDAVNVCFLQTLHACRASNRKLLVQKQGT